MKSLETNRGARPRPSGVPGDSPAAKAIVSCAESLFLTQGYEHTTMDALAGACGYTKRTIYRHFTCKEDLYFAVLLRGNRRMRSALLAAVSENPGPAAVESLLAAYRDYYLENGAFFSLMHQIGSVRQGRDVAQLPYWGRYERFAGELHGTLVKLYEEVYGGAGDHLPALTFLFVVQGFFGMMTQSGERYMEFWNLDKQAFLKQALQFLQGSLEPAAPKES